MRTFQPTDYVVDLPQEGLFRVSRTIFSDPAIFEREIRQIYERTWIFLGLESQVAHPHDFLATTIGRHPVLVTRDGQGTLRGLINACRHRGAVLCPVESGNRRLHVCPYHGWTYGSDGRNCVIPDRESGRYGAAFDREEHDLLPVPAFGSYRGFIFGCLAPDAPSLTEWLGEARFFLDLVADQGTEGLETVPGRSVWTFMANWKVQVENGDDYYHILRTHASYVEIVKRRQTGHSRNRDVVAPDWASRVSGHAGAYTFDYGHTLSWSDDPRPEQRPLFRNFDAIRRRVGDLRASWMLRNRNLTLYPSLHVGDATSLMLRVIRPLAVDRTETRIHCLAPIGEPPEVRERRIRQHEDAFGPASLANPDDHAVYESCQGGYRARSPRWLQGYQRGIAAVQQGGDALAHESGLKPATSLHGAYQVQNEVAFHGGYREWMRLMAGAAQSTD